MRAYVAGFKLICLFVAIFAFPAYAALETELIEDHQVAAKEVLVKLKSNLGTDNPAFAQALVANGVDRANPVGSNGWLLLHSTGTSAADLNAAFNRNPAVASAEPNYVISTNLIPNDQFWSVQDGMRNISGPAAWDLSTGSTSNVVAVIDTGTEYTHPDLADNIWSAPTDFSVVIDGVTITCAAGTHGYNVFTNACDPMDDHGHGTHTSGTVGAVGNNGIGVAGVNWTASVMAAKVFDAQGMGTDADAVKAIDFIIQTKAHFGAAANVRVLSNSWGGGDFSGALRDEIASARDNDMLFVAAAGNNASDNDLYPFYPASYDVENIVAVLATNQGDYGIAYFSNWGAGSVHLGAPGEHVGSTYIGGQYVYLSGTSMATPHVAGAAALVLSYCNLDTSTLKQVLLNNVDPMPALNGICVTGGRLNVAAAMSDPSCVPGP